MQTQSNVFAPKWESIKAIACVMTSKYAEFSRHTAMSVLITNFMKVVSTFYFPSFQKLECCFVSGHSSGWRHVTGRLQFSKCSTTKAQPFFVLFTKNFEKFWATSGYHRRHDLCLAGSTSLKH